MTDNKKYLAFGGRRGGGKIFALEQYIIRQKQEIACLRTEIESLQDLLVKSNNEIAKQEAEIERLNRIAIVPPCNIDDPVFFLGKYTGQIVKAYVTGIQKTQHDMFIFVDSGCFFSVNQQLGKSAFLTEEEAEKALEKENQK